MSYFKAMTTFAPLIEIPNSIWVAITEHLRQQSGGVRESGAFLLGSKGPEGRTVTKFLPYELLQADALHDDFVSISAASFSRLWDICRKEGLSVVADVHTHRFGAKQSLSDMKNPMVALSGHIAFILPDFAQRVVRLSDLGMYVYKGDHKWATYSGSLVGRALRLT